jgi:hypothetical protein
MGTSVLNRIGVNWSKYGSLALLVATTEVCNALSDFLRLASRRTPSTKKESTADWNRDCKVWTTPFLPLRAPVGNLITECEGWSAQEALARNYLHSSPRCSLIGRSLHSARR